MRNIAVAIQNDNEKATPVQTIEDMRLEEFYKKGYEIGEKLNNMWNK